MRCLICDDPLPAGARANADYCGTNCRSAAYRRRKREAAKESGAAQPEVVAQTESSSSGDRKAVTFLNDRRRRAGRAQRIVIQTLPSEANHDAIERLVSTATDRLVAAIKQVATSSRSVVGVPARVALPMQLRRLAPPAEAVGYQLVIPPAREGSVVQLSPQRSGGAWYSLAPFEYPDDLRLVDGTWYRVLWVDKCGLRVKNRDAEEIGIPGLYYFVGLPDEHETGASDYDDVIRIAKDTVHEPEVRRSVIAAKLQRARQKDADAQARRELAIRAALHQQQETELAAARQAAAAAKAAEPPPTPFPWKSVGLAALIAVPSLLSLWLGWREFTRWLNASQQPTLGPAPETRTPAEIEAAQRTLREQLAQIVSVVTSEQQSQAATAPVTPAPALSTHQDEKHAAPQAAVAVEPVTPATVQNESAASITAPPSRDPLPTDVTQSQQQTTDQSQVELGSAAAGITPSQIADLPVVTENPPTTSAINRDVTSSHHGSADDVATSSDAASVTTNDILTDPAATEEAAQASPTPTKRTAKDYEALIDTLPEADQKRLSAIALDGEMMMQVFHEVSAASARERGLPVPVEPPTDLSGEERKAARRVSSEPRQLVALLALHNTLLRVIGEKGLFAAKLPARFVPLTKWKKERFLHALESDSESEYLLYLTSKRTAIRKSLPVLPEPELGISAEQRKELRKLYRDSRIAFGFMFLVESGAAEE